MTTPPLPQLPRLLVLTDRSQLRLGRGLARTLHECATAGLEAVVVREHDLGATPWCALVDRVRDLGLVVLTSRRSHPRAHGVHLAAAQPTPGGAGWHGRSCHGRDDLVRAQREGARWATLSPYAATASKPGHGPPVDPGSFADSPLPTYALGGIDATNARVARDAGAHGVAVMGAVMRAPDPAVEVALLLAALR